jgi:fumarate reductase flavoprotein subunit
VPVVVDEDRPFELHVPVLVIGAGACGLVAALAARDASASVLVLERDASPAGSTALSSGFIPAAGTRFQRAKGVVDSPGQLAADIQRKNHGEADPGFVEAVCNASGPTIEWLADRHGMAFVLVEGFLYPGHGALRMHAVPERTGAALMAALQRAAATAGVDLLCSAHAMTLYTDRGRRVRGVAFTRPDASMEEVGCDALVLASSGFGGNPGMVKRHLPEIADALYFGHAGNQGDAIEWGTQLGAAVKDLTAYQGHGSVATPHGVLITWALMTEGGIQVNSDGRRFSNEHAGYSEQCLPVLKQPGGVAWDVYDERLHGLGLEFEDYRQADTHGAIRRGETIEALAAVCGLPAPALRVTLAEVERCAAGEAPDPFGRDFTTKPKLSPPYFAVKVTGSLFHTQGGLVVDGHARVLDERGFPLPNLFAGGGAACGLSGAQVWGYLSGNGLLSAVTLGRLAGTSAAEVARSAAPRNPRL